VIKVTVLRLANDKGRFARFNDLFQPTRITEVCESPSDATWFGDRAEIELLLLGADGLPPLEIVEVWL
jgi:hypothetical protein